MRRREHRYVFSLLKSVRIDQRIEQNSWSYCGYYWERGIQALLSYTICHVFSTSGENMCYMHAVDFSFFYARCNLTFSIGEPLFQIKPLLAGFRNAFKRTEFISNASFISVWLFCWKFIWILTNYFQASRFSKTSIGYTEPHWVVFAVKWQYFLFDCIESSEFPSRGFRFP